MGYTNYSYRDQQLQDLDEHRQGCFIFTLFFVALTPLSFPSYPFFHS